MLEGSAVGRDKPTISLIARADPIAFDFGEQAAVVVDGELLVSRNHNTLTLRNLTTFATRKTLVIDNPFTPPFQTRVHLFAIGGLVYVGPIFRGAPYVYVYDPTTETVTQGPLLQDGLTAAAQTAVAHGTRIFYFFENGTGIVFDTATSQAQSFDTGKRPSDHFVTAFVVNDQPWVVTTSGYHRLDPAARSLTRVDMFNGAVCFARGWPGPTHSTSSFVLGDRVYFVGGTDAAGKPVDYRFFLGARF